MLALQDKKIDKAMFISPIVDMEKLICTMMEWAGVTEEELAERIKIPTDFGETLNWNYLSWVRKIHTNGINRRILYTAAKTT